MGLLFLLISSLAMAQERTLEVAFPHAHQAIAREVSKEGVFRFVLCQMESGDLLDSAECRPLNGTYFDVADFKTAQLLTISLAQEYRRAIQRNLRISYALEGLGWLGALWSTMFVARTFDRPVPILFGAVGVGLSAWKIHAERSARGRMQTFVRETVTSQKPVQEWYEELRANEAFRVRRRLRVHNGVLIFTDRLVDGFIEAYRRASERVFCYRAF